MLIGAQLIGDGACALWKAYGCQPQPADVTPYCGGLSKIFSQLHSKLCSTDTCPAREPFASMDLFQEPPMDLFQEPQCDASLATALVPVGSVIDSTPEPINDLKPFFEKPLATITEVAPGSSLTETIGGIVDKAREILGDYVPDRMPALNETVTKVGCAALVVGGLVVASKEAITVCREIRHVDSFGSFARLVGHMGLVAASTFVAATAAEIAWF